MRERVPAVPAWVPTPHRRISGSPTSDHHGSATTSTVTQPSSVIQSPKRKISPAETWPRFHSEGASTAPSDASPQRSIAPAKPALEAPASPWYQRLAHHPPPRPRDRD